MVFSSAAFLSVLLPAAAAGSWLFRKHVRVQNALLLLLSLVFYAWGDLRYLPVMVLSALGNALMGRLAWYYRQSKWPVLLAAVLNIGVLVWYKYSGFTMSVLHDLTGLQTGFAAPSLPLGVSFFTFQGLSYVIDMKKSDEKPGSVMDVCLYVCLFPQLVAGPIVRWDDIRRELKSREVSLNGIGDGFERFIPGLAKKVLLADTLGKLADAAFALPDADRGALLALLGGIAFCLQLFFDFSGYSDMAIGLGKMFGFRFPENFADPYRSVSMQEFWRRWHMTLSRWFRDYVYIPLGGNRKGAARTLINTAVVFTLTGIWHGAGWTFLLWGVWNGLFVILEHARVLKPDKWPKLLARLYTLAVVLLGFIVFRADSLTAAGGYIASLTHVVPTEAMAHALLFRLDPVTLIALAAAVLVCVFAGMQHRHALSPNIRYILCFVLLAVCYLSIISSGYHPFLYFRF